MRVPMVREDETIGALERRTRIGSARSPTSKSSWCRPSPPRPSSLSRTRGCSTSCAESLQQQTATADVLKVISCSPGDLEPVFKAMLANATRLCEAKFGTLYLYEGDVAPHFAAISMPLRPLSSARKDEALRPGPGHGRPRGIGPSRSSSSRCHMREAVPEGDPFVAGTDLGGARTILSSRCSRTTSWSASSPFIARRCCRSPTSRSSW